MSSPIRVDTRELDRAIDKLAGELAGPAGTQSATVAVRGLLPGVVQRTPVRTGRLAGSWRVEPAEHGAAISSSEEHAGPIEYGVPGRFDPFRMVRDTLEAEERELVEGYERAIADAARHAGFDVRS